MLLADGEGLPLGFHLASANHHEIKLAVPALESVRVPVEEGADRSGAPQSWSQIRPTTAGVLGSGCALEGSSRRFLLTSGVRESAPNEDGPLRSRRRATQSAGRRRGPSPGSATSAGCWCATNATFRSSERSYWSRSLLCYSDGSKNDPSFQGVPRTSQLNPSCRSTRQNCSKSKGLRM